MPYLLNERTQPILMARNSARIPLTACPDQKLHRHGEEPVVSGNPIGARIT